MLRLVVLGLFVTSIGCTRPEQFDLDPASAYRAEPIAAEFLICRSIGGLDRINPVRARRRWVAGGQRRRPSRSVGRRGVGRDWRRTHGGGAVAARVAPRRRVAGAPSDPAYAGDQFRALHLARDRADGPTARERRPLLAPDLACGPHF